MTTLGPFELGPETRHPAHGIYYGDARQLIPLLPDRAAALAFADPPYWVGFDYGDGRTDTEMDFVDPHWLIGQLRRIAPIVLVTSSVAMMWKYPEPDWVMAWDKGNSMKRYRWGFAHFEPILCYGTPNIPQHKMRPDVYRAPIVVVEHSHRCPKPLHLMEQLVATFTEPGDVVIDPFMGSGTTALAAHRLGREYLGFEIDLDTVIAARERVRNTQPPLLVPQAEQLGLEISA